MEKNKDNKHLEPFISTDELDEFLDMLLEWATHKEQKTHEIKNGLCDKNIEALKISNKKRAIPIIFKENKYHYEYIDLDNNNGIAKECSYKSKEYKSGGQGSTVCELEDGTIKQVKEYKYIYDGKYIPIKEIFE